jgi:ribulose 1,5-bisphosphate synthetase/thiazole synthase
LFPAHSSVRKISFFAGMHLREKKETTIHPVENQEGRSPSSVNNHTNLNVIIIGAGAAGLTCAAYLIKAGIHTLVFEAHSQPIDL